MKTLNILRSLVTLLLFQVALAHAQSYDMEALKDLRKRYQNSLGSMYLTDTALNDLTVHLRNEKAVRALVKLGSNLDALNAFRKFLDGFADRALLMIDLQSVRAGYKTRSDLSAALQFLPWSEGTVVHVAILCDKYLQGQWKLGQLTVTISKATISLDDAWGQINAFRQDPYVPVVALTDSLQAFVRLSDKKKNELTNLAKQNPIRYGQITVFKSEVSDVSPSTYAFVPYELPAKLKVVWVKRWNILEGYGKSTDEASLTVWRGQLTHLQALQFRQLELAAMPKNEAPQEH